MLNWIVWNRTDYLHKNGFGVNNLQRLILHKTQQTKLSLLNSSEKPSANASEKKLE